MYNGKYCLNKFFGKGELIKVIEFFAENSTFDFPKEEIANGAGILPGMLQGFLPHLIDYNIIRETRKIGKSQFYKYNSESEIAGVLKNLSFQIGKYSYWKEREKNFDQDSDCVGEEEEIRRLKLLRDQAA